jgi:phosphatidylglycerol:prolipoprotein diacylglycerol transferase
MYGLMIALGFFIALYFTQRDAKKLGLDPNIIGGMGAGALLFGIIGTRLMHIILFPEGYSWRDPVGWVAIWQGGLVFQGALPGALIYIFYSCRKNKTPFWLLCDCAVPYLALAHAFGRIGCFMNGCCYGACSSLPWAIRFPRVPWDVTKPAEGSPAYLDHCQRFSDMSFGVDHWSHPVHPTQLYGVFGLIALCLILLVLRKRWNPFTGFLMPVYLVLYSVGRFFVEFLRGDHNPTTFGVISDQQVMCIISIAVGVALFIFLRSLLRESPKKA